MTIPATPAWQAQPRPGYQINSTAISGHGERCVLGTSEEYGSGAFGVYCYDSAGAELWADLFDHEIYQGVFWVAISDDGKYAAAGGASSQSGAQRGFLHAYDIATGERMLTEALPGRVNEVELSADGSTMIAATDSEIRLYRRQAGWYLLSDTHTFFNQYCISCGISAAGSRVVAGTYRNYGVSTGPASFVQVFDVQNDNLVACGRACTSLDKVLRVAIVADGSWWGASQHDGACAGFTALSLTTGSPVWTYSPPHKQLSVAYAFAITKTDDGEVIAACGANESGAGHGCVYAVKVVPSDASPSSVAAVLLWLNELEYDPNPGVNMDGQARYVTATDGQPYSSEQKRAPIAADGRTASDGESPGNFYLFDRASGEQLWRLPTSMMNWPMAISTDGTAIFAASDNGTAYYWRAKQEPHALDEHD